MSSNCKHSTCDGEVCRREPKPKKAPTPLKRNKVPLKMAAVKRYNAKPKPKNDELEQFFVDCADIINKQPYCIECNDYISANLYRFATAHIFPKAQFPSVSAHPLNWLKLGSLCGCHSRTHRMDTFSKMNCFKVAVERFRQFEHLITETHSYLDLFKTYADKLN